jgi:hypothetical protein
VHSPLQEEHVTFINLRLQVPGRLRDLGEQLRERGADAVLAAHDPDRGDEDGIVGVIGYDLIQVTAPSASA